MLGVIERHTKGCACCPKFKQENRHALKLFSLTEIAAEIQAAKKTVSFAPWSTMSKR